MTTARLPELREITGPWWDGKPTVIVGAGPSIPQDFDFNQLRDRFHVLAVKQMHRHLPFADLCFAIDHPWMRRQEDELRDKKVPLLLGVYNELPRKHPLFDHASYVEMRADDGLSLNPSIVFHGGTSGYGAIGAAFHKRARDIFLLGFDYKVLDNGAGGEIHHHKNEDYPWYPRRNRRYWERWGRSFELIAAGLKKQGVRVRNVSSISSITAFERTTYEELLA